MFTFRKPSHSKQHTRSLSVQRLYKSPKVLLYISILALCAAALFFSLFLTRDSRSYQRLTKELFLSELSGDTLSLHYTLAFPENYGIEGKAALPIYQPGTTETETLESLFTQLTQIHPEHLNENDRFSYELLKAHLEQQLAGTEFTYYSEPLSPSSGMQSGLPILLADYTFRSVKDVEDYLQLLEQIDSYFQGLILYEQEKAQEGLFMSDTSVRKVILECDAIMDENALSQGTHFLHTTFKERIDSLESDGLITAREKEQYLSQNDRLLTTVVAPAYQSLGDALLLLEGSGTNTMGLSYFPKGADYYQYRLQLATCTDRSIPELKQMLYADFQKNYGALLTLIARYPELTSLSADNSNSFPMSTPVEMLQDLQNQTQKDFPPFPESQDHFLPSCTVKSVSPAMEDYSSPAYYLTPPIDDMSSNTIYINHKNMPDALTLYTTLAHEGYPGHLYQTVYSQLYMEQQQINPIRHLLHYGGYIEGWALYVENLSYEYAKAAAAKDSPLLAAWYEACRLNRNIQLCVYSLLDIAIHYEGATFETVQKILSQIGITSPETAALIYEYIVEEPTNYPKYYVGYLEFSALRDKAVSLWGENFSLKKFHQFVLETGPCDFGTLNRMLPLSCP